MAQAFLLINCFNKSNNLEEKLIEIPNIREVESVVGTYDYIAKTEDLPKSELRKMIRKEIRPIKNIRSTLTLDKIASYDNLST